jgi:diaminohydroxyphosphoribosylaminopyrimidine deaminase/5-amino-6-(5-phosphoribosylamino)uracil reductase
MQAGVEVKSGVLEKECQHINRRFFCFHQKHRPYIILKWAQTADGYIGSGTTERWLISNEMTNKLVHRWRGEEAAIMVGANTVRMDNPQLTNRSGYGSQPIRVVVDRNLNLSYDYKVFDQQVPTIILNEKKQGQEGVLSYLQLNLHLSFVESVCEALYAHKIQSVLIEGGAQLLSLFIKSGSWDEARVITNTSLQMGKGVKAPEFTNGTPDRVEKISADTISYYINNQNKIN